MQKTAASIVKANDVIVEGRFCLNINQPGPESESSHRSVLPQVRLLEKNTDYAVIEITCGCGSKIRLRCDYDATTA
ncbi:MAG TPA: hypothetical protein PK052_00090 [Anaerohalosphaeraceae bacterium]|nr:hypothetical protein [Anaerohalosphaeraceae bacterium]HOL30353.1 hypothetical protein [Anaerohalosphaeraceae bacterium]HOM76719.1 hypothetical protein [Anaerohalosphaeraceae bacterium]HPC63051.1 hypothetical protein [Anaerohalosphaeraceae bacterium]HPO69250.1 hypothetical protein [Anaerohalosphaeraceae bacterium]